MSVLRREELEAKKGANSVDFEGFSEESLNEMSMGTIEGGIDPDLACGNSNNKGCIYNQVAGCACPGGYG